MEEIAGCVVNLNNGHEFLNDRPDPLKPYPDPDDRTVRSVVIVMNAAM